MLSPTEREIARNLANRVLDRISGDPDDDVVLLARQFLRAEERQAGLISLLVELRDAVKNHPDFQSREKFLSLGMRVAEALKHDRNM